MSEKKIFHRIGLSLAIFLVLWVGIQILLVRLLNYYAPGAMSRMEWLYWLVTSGPIYLIAFPAIIKLLKPLPTRRLYEHRLRPGHFMQAFFVCVALMLIGNVIGIIVTTVLNNATGVEFSVDLTSSMMNFNLGWVFVTSVIVGPLVEEIIFRKLLIDRMIMFGDGAAIVISALLFGLTHGNLTQAFYACGLGLILGFIYVRTGKVRYTALLHMLMNFVCGFVPVLFMKRIDLFSLQENIFAGNGTIIINRLGALLGFAGFELLVLICGVAGFVLLITNRKKFFLYKGEIEMRRLELAKTILKTPGMWLWIAAIVALFIINIVGI